MDQIGVTYPAVFHPVGYPPRSERCEGPDGGRVDELLPGGLCMVDGLLKVLTQDMPLINESFDFLGDLQTYLLMCFHLSLYLAADRSGQPFIEMMPVY